MKRLLPSPAREAIDLVAVLHALADPVRLALVRELSDGVAQTCKNAGESVDVAASTLSHHYRVLREAGIISTTAEGRLRWIQLRREDLDARFPSLLDAVVAGAAVGSELP